MTERDPHDRTGDASDLHTSPDKEAAAEPHSGPVHPEEADVTLDSAHAIFASILGNSAPAADASAAPDPTRVVHGSADVTQVVTASMVPPDQQIGNYRILREVGRGGMGLVYVAEDLRLGRQVALKILPQHLAGDPSAFQRFKSEARLLAQMNHPNIAIIHSLEASDSVQFLTMELIQGETLQGRLGRGPLPVGEWFVVSKQIATALEAAHANGIVHLDLKPGNVMITPDGLVKVLDFGLAMAPGRETDGAEGARTRARTQDTIGGTPGYMSPEQALGKSIDSRADVFAFGSVLYETIAGQPAFAGSNVSDKLRATLTHEPDLGLVPAELPDTMRDLIRRCLAKDANRRIGSVTQVLEELDRALQIGTAPRDRTTPNNLPISLSKFVGRTTAKAQVKDLLLRHPVLTVTGVGGGGKTRFALELARELLGEFPDGVWLVDLAPLADESRVPSELRAVLGLREEAGRDPVETLVDHLSARSTLLVLDGCERYLAATAGLLNTLMRRCPDLRVLCTSREPLAINGEAIYQLSVLSVPREGAARLSLAELAEVEAIQLFVDRATATRPGFALTNENATAILQICQRLDGIPLAIELAAARVRVLSPADIANRLDDRFRLLTSSDRGMIPHHQTLRALIDWSHDHLSAIEQQVFRRFAVFAGGWTIEAAERICTGPDLDEWELLDHLSSLVEKCLVEVDSDASHRTGRTRYRMLETIRAYARQKLRESDEVRIVQTAHRAHFLAVAEEADAQLLGPDQSTCLARLAEDHDNFLVALDAEDPAEDFVTRLHLAGALGRYWQMRGHWTEGRAIYARLLDGREVPETSGAANALNWAGNLSKIQSDYANATNYLERGLELRRGLGDPAGIARSLHNLGNVMKDIGDLERARALYEEGLALQESLGNRASVADSYNGLGLTALQAGDRPLARSLFEQSLAVRRELRSPGPIADSLNNLGWIALADDRLDNAIAHYTESLAIYRDLGNRGGVAASLHNLGNLMEKRRDLDQARVYYEESLAISRELGNRASTARTLHGLATLHQAAGRVQETNAMFHESATLLAAIGDRTTLARVLEAWARLHVSQGALRPGLQLLGAAQSCLGSDAREFLVSEPWAGLRESIGADEFDATYQEGCAGAVEDAIAAGGKSPVLAK